MAVKNHKNIAVIGAGTMGNGIAHVFAQYGYDVHLVDVSAEALKKAIETISGNLDRQVKKNILSENDKTETLKRIRTFTTISEGCKDRDLIIKAEDKIEKPDSMSSYSFYKRCTLPENTDFDAIKCHFENNKLAISAPLLPELKQNYKKIPIENVKQN